MFWNSLDGVPYAKILRQTEYEIGNICRWEPTVYLETNSLSRPINRAMSFVTDNYVFKIEACRIKRYWFVYIHTILFVSMFNGKQRDDNHQIQFISYYYRTRLWSCGFWLCHWHFAYLFLNCLLNIARSTYRSGQSLAD